MCDDTETIVLDEYPMPYPLGVPDRIVKEVEQVLSTATAAPPPPLYTIDCHAMSMADRLDADERVESWLAALGCEPELSHRICDAVLGLMQRLPDDACRVDIGWTFATGWFVKSTRDAAPNQ